MGWVGELGGDLDTVTYLVAEALGMEGYSDAAEVLN